jgi:hypothetical protein
VGGHTADSTGINKVRPYDLFSVIRFAWRAGTFTDSTGAKVDEMNEEILGPRLDGEVRPYATTHANRAQAA